MQIPDRFSDLIAKVESGQPVTQKDVDRLTTLQSLDLLKTGDDFAREAIQREDAHSKLLEELSGNP